MYYTLVNLLIKKAAGSVKSYFSSFDIVGPWPNVHCLSENFTIHYVMLLLEGLVVLSH